MAQYFLGEVMATAINFAPTTFMPCDGRILEIRFYTALFSLLGTTYGGDGKSTFALPDMRGRTPMGMGLGAGLSERLEGEVMGTEAAALNEPQMGAHSHGMKVTKTRATQANPAGNYFGGAATGQSDAAPLTASPSPHFASPAMVTPSGSGLPHSNMQPSLVIGYYICVNGLFPSRW